MKRFPDSGAALIEFALIVPVLVLVLVGIFELGMAFKDYLTVSYTAREGARLTAFLGTHVDADCHAVTSMAQGISAIDLERIDRIEIFKADPAGQQLMSATNTFHFSGTDPLDCDDWSKSITWPSHTRQTLIGTFPLDVIGVRVVLDRTWVTGLPPFAGTMIVNENTIVRMEPEAFE